MRRRWTDRRIKFYIGDVRYEQSLKDAMAAVDFLISIVQEIYPDITIKFGAMKSRWIIAPPFALERLVYARARVITVIADLNTAALALDRGYVAQRLFGSLEVVITKARSMLGWTPPVLPWTRGYAVRVVAV